MTRTQKKGDEVNVLIGCEFSGVVRDAFIDAGHNAVSCDLLPSESGKGPHMQCDVFEAIEAQPWDLAVFHPPCTYLSNSGVRWLYEKPGRWEQMREAARFFKRLLEVDIPRIAVENPIIHKHAVEIIGRKQDQMVQPWMFCTPETKGICLWLKNLPPLKPMITTKPANIEERVWRMGPSPERAKERSRFFPMVAWQMARQWTESHRDPQ